MGLRSKSAAAIVVIVVCLGTAAYAAQRLHGVRVDATVADIGVVKQGQLVRHSFRLRNHGWANATIVRVEPECGVFASVPRDRTLRSGGAAEFEVRVDTSLIEDAMRRLVRVTLADPFERTLTLSVTGKIEPEFLLETPVVDFGVVSGREAAVREVKIKLRETRHDLLTARSTDDAFESDLRTSSPRFRRYARHPHSAPRAFGRELRHSADRDIQPSHARVDPAGKGYI